MGYRPAEPGQFAFSVFNIIYGLGCVAVIIWVPLPEAAPSWLPAAVWPFVALFLILNVAGLIDSR